MESKKKTISASEQKTPRIKHLRKRFKKWQKKLGKTQRKRRKKGKKPLPIICLDETGFKPKMIPLYGWSPKGTRVKDDTSGKHERTITVIGAIGLSGFITSAIGYGGTSSDMFYAFMKNELLPKLKKGTFIVLDNLSAHRNNKVRELVQSFGCKLIFQPPYSPEYNPIELAWGFIKNRMKPNRPKTLEEITSYFLEASEAIPTQTFQNWFRKCGF